MPLGQPVDDGRCKVRWAVWFELNPWLWRPFAGTFIRTFAAAMNEGLQNLASQHKNA